MSQTLFFLFHLIFFGFFCQESCWQFPWIENPFICLKKKKDGSPNIKGKEMRRRERENKCGVGVGVGVGIGRERRRCEGENINFR
jgi:hypothetical protein